MVHPSFNSEDEGRPTSACLVPTTKDEGKLSVDRSDYIDAHGSFERFVLVEKLVAVGVITFAHALSLRHGLPGYYWPLPANDAHSFLNFKHLSANQASKAGRKLFRAAWDASGERWSYRPGSEPGLESQAPVG